MYEIADQVRNDAPKELARRARPPVPPGPAALSGRFKGVREVSESLRGEIEIPPGSLTKQSIELADATSKTHK